MRLKVSVYIFSHNVLCITNHVTWLDHRGYIICGWTCGVLWFKVNILAQP